MTDTEQKPDFRVAAFWFVEERPVAWSFPDIAKRMLVIYGKVSEAKEKDRQEKLIAETENVFDITDRLGRIG